MRHHRRSSSEFPALRAQPRGVDVSLQLGEDDAVVVRGQIAHGEKNRATSDAARMRGATVRPRCGERLTSGS